MKFLVTGAHGFIGSHLCEHLIAQGYQVRALISPWGTLTNLSTILENPYLEVCTADITKPEDLHNICKDIEVVFHAAAKVKDWGLWSGFYKTNVEGTRNLLQEAERQKVKRFVIISSVAVHQYTGFRYANPRKLSTDGNINNYAKSKVLAEEIVLAANLESVIIRPGLLPFGTRDPNLLRVARALKQGLLPLIGGGKTVINTAYVGNLVQGLYLAGTKSKVGKIYVIADEGMPSWYDIFSYLAQLIQAPKPRIHLPTNFVKPLAALENIYAEILPNTEPPVTHYRSHLMTQDVHFSIAHAKKELGYNPKISWQEGLTLSFT